MPTNRRKRTIRREAPGEDAMVVETPEQLRALGDPTRWRILGYLLEGPASIQELANGLGRAKGTIGHHVRVLDRAGMIRLAETRRVRGVIERRYERVAPRFSLGREGEELPPGIDEATLAHLPLRTAVAEARAVTGPNDPTGSIVVRARMPADRARRFVHLVEALAEEFVAGASGEGETFGFVAGVYVPDWQRAREA